MRPLGFVMLIMVILQASQVSGHGKLIEIQATLKYSAKIYSAMSVLSQAVGSLRAGSKVDIVDYVHRSDYWKVKTGTVSGYVLEVNLIMIDTLAAIKENKRLEYRLSLKSSFNKRRRKAFADLKAHQRLKTRQDIERIRDTYGPASANKIIAGYVWNGMTREMAVESWGEPDHIAKRAGRGGIIEQWAYDPTHFLFFSERKVIIIAKQIKNPNRWILFDSEHGLRLISFHKTPEKLPYPD